MSIKIISSIGEKLEILDILDLVRNSDNLCYLLIAEKNELASLHQIISAACKDTKILIFPAWDNIPYDHTSPSTECLAQRVECLSVLSTKTTQKTVILSCISSLSQKLPPKNLINLETQSIKKKGTYFLLDLTFFLQKAGYIRVETVVSRGTFAQRGHILDCFPTGYDHPFRLDFFGDEIESIRFFDPETQRSLDEVESIFLRPSSEILLSKGAQENFCHAYRFIDKSNFKKSILYQQIQQGILPAQAFQFLPLFYDHLETFFDYLPSSTCVIKSPHFNNDVQKFYDQIKSNYDFRRGFLSEDTDLNDPPLPPDQFYLSYENLETRLLDFDQYILSSIDEKNATRSIYSPLYSLGISRKSRLEKIKHYLQTTDKKVQIAALLPESQAKIKHFLQDNGIKKILEFISIPFERSFQSADQIVFVESDFFEILTFSKRKPKSKEKVLEISDFQVGDYLIHYDHGIGRYQGLETLLIQGASHDCLVLLYQNENKLFVPVENIDVLSYFASKFSDVTTDRLGSTAWQIRKAKAKKRIEEIAQRLIRTAAERHFAESVSLEKLDESYEFFCKGFGFVETDDQDQAIKDILSDLKKSTPMDRLICGDVGFGKTEVALRAAFSIISQGGQVALLTPTTLLARQHYETCKKRFQDFPYNVALISRFQTNQEIQKIHQQLKDGTLDFVIGTHSLLSPKTEFKNLSMLIIDEEQHFGVKQKELLKFRYPHIHCLSLSATPIPRTLQMAISGIRDLSLITTPPLERKPILTKVIPFDPLIIKEALIQEKERGGQSFFVCPRVVDINHVLPILKRLLPSFKIGIAHGQLPAKVLEDTIIEFCDHKHDLLVSTNIIESGLDIPSANTLIAYRSDLFGLSQLYQLRGRVGRGKTQGRALITLTADKQLTLSAQRRLEVLQNLTHVGGGFTIASHDLDIRGTGNLVGEEQSGQIKEVGLNLYQHMLAEAIQKLRQEQGQKVVKQDFTEWHPQLNLGLEVSIPQDYVGELDLRLGLYQRIGQLKTVQAISDFQDELIDRFGPIPEETKNLLSIVSLKNLCLKLNIHKIDVGPKGILVSFYQDMFPWPERLIPLMQKSAGTLQLRSDQKLVIFKAWPSTQQKIEGLFKLLSSLDMG